ncbi:MAG TPA: thioether cross-link-forming SCIFF peptide maturase [Oscillospiraceae bacterium]|nr:thioether cross-link-forming SCIFF peptide maturase [Oscillospiraceae bacterium]HXK76956.1 thioether cross-link-forming SCIFF peptide maturase [Oscillospiraceae bacterium]
MVHTFFLNGYYLALDVNSGAVHMLDEETYDILNALLPGPIPAECGENVVAALSGKYPEEDIHEIYGELYQLQQNGQLFSEDDYERFTELMKGAPIKSMCLHISHDCNLRCKYCFASTGDFGTGRMLMPVETGKKAIDFLLTHSGNRHNLELDFFGGEPLMNWGAVEEIVKYARSKEAEYHKLFRFTVTTNGVLLNDENIAFINKEMKNVVLSLDGRKKVNDNLRVTINGGGSYDIIVPKFQKLVEQRRNGPFTEYYARGTFTKYNLDFTEDIYHIDALGFDQLSVEPVIADPSEPYALTEEDLPVIFEQYEKLAKEMVRRKKEGNCFNFFHFMIDLDQGPCAIKRLRGCGCGNEYVAVTPDGDIYPCHQFVGKEEWKMGNLDTGELNAEIKDKFACSNVYTKQGCRDCWAKFYCSGGCNANNYEQNGDINIPTKLSCEIERKRVECAIMIKAATAENA